MRMKFREGEQKKFMQQVLDSIACPSLRRLKERGIDVNYQTLKSYFNENRTLPQSLMQDLCALSKINPKSIKAKILEDRWGQSKGGKR
jgi:ATP-dependent Zn protease